MYVYRVELKASGINLNPVEHVPKYLTNLGPYRARYDMSIDTCRWLSSHKITPPYAMPYHESRHPTPGYDLLLKENILKVYPEHEFVIYTLSYGFMDNDNKTGLERLFDWFDEESIRSMNNAFCIMKYNARECYDGELQSVFDLNTATLEDILFFEDMGK